MDERLSDFTYDRWDQDEPETGDDWSEEDLPDWVQDITLDPPE